MRKIVLMGGTSTVVLALIALPPARLGAQQTTVPFVVGVFGEIDAIILPFADFDGRTWRSSWPEPRDVEPALRPLKQIPSAWWGRSTFQPVWELVERDGRRRELRIVGTGSSGLGSSCSINIGLETDAPKVPDQYEKALAASHPGVVAPIEQIPPGSDEWRTVSALLPGIYQQHEADGWKEVPDNFRPSMTGGRPLPTLEAAFASTDEQGQYVYFESYRELVRRPNQLGTERSFITGWLWRRFPVLPFQSVTVRATTRDEDRKGVHSFGPLGVVRQGARRFWLGSLDSYAYGALAVLDVRRNGVTQLVITEYPGC